MSSADRKKVEAAIAAYLEFMEMGGRAPDYSALTTEERAQVDEVVAVLDATEGVAMRSARPEPRRRRTAEHLAAAASSESERTVLSMLAETVPPGTPVDSDQAPDGFAFPSLPVTAGWTVGTVGGRIRVWLIDVDTAARLESDTSHLESLDKVFRAFPETAAICLVAGDLTSLLLEPEDCAPVIEVPAGGILARRYRRPIQPAGDAVAGYMRELVPAWEALPRFDAGTATAVDVPALARHAAADAVELQRAAGARARYPKKEVLSALGEAEAEELASLAIGLYEGVRDASEVEARLRKLSEAR